MAKQSDEVKVYFKITGFDCPPSNITNLIGIEATKTWLKGDLTHPKAIIKHRQNGWMLQSSLSKDTPLREQIESLLDIVLPRKGVLRKLPNGSEKSILCAVYSVDGRPDISLPADVIIAIAEIGANLDLDLYLLPSEEKNK
jgi:hypothetical protein